MASRENIPHTVRAATAQAISDELPEESTSSWCLRYTACHSPGWIVRFPLILLWRCFCQRCDQGMVTETEEDTPYQRCSACPSHCAKEQPSDRASMLEKGNPGEIHVRVAWKSRATRGWVMRASVAEAEAASTSAGCSCNAVYCTAALTLTSSREQRERNTDHSQHPFPTLTCFTSQSECRAWM